MCCPGADRCGFGLLVQRSDARDCWEDKKSKESPPEKKGTVSATTLLKHMVVVLEISERTPFVKRRSLQVTPCCAGLHVQQQNYLRRSSWEFCTALEEKIHRGLTTVGFHAYPCSGRSWISVMQRLVAFSLAVQVFTLGTCINYVMILTTKSRSN